MIMSIESLLRKINMNEAGIDASCYSYNGYPVPRVTEILSSMIHEDHLMKWSNFIGRIKHQKYEDVLDQAANKGSYVHNGIEDFLKNSQDLDISSIPHGYRNEVSYAYDSFKMWWDIVSSKKYNIIMQEQTLVCPWFGGTLDILIEIFGNIYLLDFKTSNYASFKYFLQLAAYKYMLREIYGIDIHGCGIIKLNKKEIRFEEYIIDKSIDEYFEFTNLCEETFLSLVYAYFNRINVENMYRKIFY